MKEHIEREAIEKAIHKPSMFDINKEDFLALLADIPAADVVEVIRCKDCKWFTKDGLCFTNVKGVGYMKPTEDHFCSYGERKDGAENDR